ncbi:hypothetical protein [Pedobacter sp. Hv1]|uniref:hypothetical protein n=1 Tax=Pedobacter sp. Hv1 TaxID=1740090 RepID=UPI0006D8B551|nr:hypothetical protein [Pedobacter sp. Hv1]KQB99842.1 hypothetical protein AQF98_15105 [Pedobacter sp. Hv1]
MESKKAPKNKPFPDALIKQWEKNDGVDFAIALARITGWILQVDWLCSREDDDVHDMVPLRVYVETNRDVVFDFTGKKSMMAFHKYTIMPIASKRLKNGLQNKATRSYTEQELREMPLRVRASDYGIEKATQAILANSAYLALIPKRENSYISGHDAVLFSQGNCVPFADAVQQLTSLPAVGIEVSAYSEECGSQLGFCHAVILHPDGTVEDSWGVQPLSVILERFYIKDYQISPQIFEDAKQRHIRENPDRYMHAYKKAVSLLTPYR